MALKSGEAADIRSGVSTTESSKIEKPNAGARRRRHAGEVRIADDHVDRQHRAVRAILAGNEFFSRLFHELHVLNECTLPATGPAILVSNHTAGLDPLLLQSACSRLVVWMMAKEYYDIPGLRYVFGKLQMIPVERSGRDMTATRAALRALENGRVLGVFPEGRIEIDRQLLPFQTGVALLAVKSGAPVYPAYLDGTQRGREMVPSLLRPCSATLAFGPAVQLDRSQSGREGLESATAAIQAAVQRLKDRCDGNE
jgi:1-acyl-sn-glycerol-3-phosphate acyltransferase